MRPSVGLLLGFVALSPSCILIVEDSAGSGAAGSGAAGSGAAGSGGSPNSTSSGETTTDATGTGTMATSTGAGGGQCNTEIPIVSTILFDSQRIEALAANGTVVQMITSDGANQLLYPDLLAQPSLAELITAPQPQLLTRTNGQSVVFTGVTTLVGTTSTSPTPLTPAHGLDLAAYVGYSAQPERLALGGKGTNQEERLLWYDVSGSLSFSSPHSIQVPSPIQDVAFSVNDLCWVGKDGNAYACSVNSLACETDKVPVGEGFIQHVESRQNSAGGDLLLLSTTQLEVLGVGNTPPYYLMADGVDFLDVVAEGDAIVLLQQVGPQLSLRRCCGSSHPLQCGSAVTLDPSYSFARAFFLGPGGDIFVWLENNDPVPNQTIQRVSWANTP